jgi:ring-1,2-phenylacetyl-CoA epoxidase subunit PaaE
VVTTHFHPLRIAQVRRETPDAISIVFDIPDGLADTYRFTQGQHLTLRAKVGDEELRRSYSICAGVGDPHLRIAIKAVESGSFSTWANTVLSAGMSVDVMPPAGRFFTTLDPGQRKHYVAFVAGSGITPVLSLIRTTLAREPSSRFTLVYGNRTIGSILFAEELQDLKDRYLDRFVLHHVLSREAQDVALFSGRIDGDKCHALLSTLLPADDIDEAFICGPESMMETVSEALHAAGVDRAHIHVERFVTPSERRGAGVPAGMPPQLAAIVDPVSSAEVVVIADGVTRTIRVPFEGATILDTALAAGADLPFACKGGVCCTCRARVLEGEVTMDRNWSLEAAELARGFVLSCQSHPATSKVVISYDERL